MTWFNGGEVFLGSWLDSKNLEGFFKWKLILWFYDKKREISLWQFSLYITNIFSPFSGSKLEREEMLELSFLRLRFVLPNITLHQNLVCLPEGIFSHGSTTSQDIWSIFHVKKGHFCFNFVHLKQIISIESLPVYPSLLQTRTN